MRFCKRDAPILQLLPASFAPLFATMRLALSTRAEEDNVLPRVGAGREQIEGAEILHFDAPRNASSLFSSPSTSSFAGFVVVGLSTRPLQLGFPPLFRFSPSAATCLFCAVSPFDERSTSHLPSSGKEKELSMGRRSF